MVKYRISKYLHSSLAGNLTEVRKICVITAVLYSVVDACRNDLSFFKKNFKHEAKKSNLSGVYVMLKREDSHIWDRGNVGLI